MDKNQLADQSVVAKVDKRLKDIRSLRSKTLSLLKNKKMKKNKILVLCTGNSCRSQMADGFLKYYAETLNKDVEVYSAGVETHGVNPKAIKVMLEKGIDLSNNTSDLVDDYLNSGITHLISVCDHAIESCPVFPEKVNHIHHTFNDPAKATGSDEDILNSFRNTRDQIDIFCKEYLTQNF